MTVEKPQITDQLEEMHGEQGWTTSIKVMGAVGVCSVLTLVGLSRLDGDSEPLPVAGISEEAPDATTPSTEAAPDEACAPTWEMPGVEVNEQSRWFADGISEIRDATTEEEARDAMSAWIYGTDEHPGIRDDAQLLATGHKAIVPLFISEGIVFASPEDLVDAEGCATERASELVVELESAIALADVQAVDEITEAGRNTGFTEAGVTIADSVGVSGDTKSIKLTNTEDGCSVYIMARCGQPVFTINCDIPSLPEGPTDNPPAPKNPNTPEVPETPEENSDKEPEELPGPRPNPGSGGRPEENMDPENDSDNDGYGPNDSRPSIPPATNQTTPPTTNGVTPTTGGPRPTAPPAPVTTQTSVPNHTMPPAPRDDEGVK